MNTNTKKVGLLLIAGLILSSTPSRAQTIMNELQNNSQTTQFAQALKNAGLDEKLNGSGTYTVLAPSNNAFGRLSSSQKTRRNLLLNHVLTGMATERNLNIMSKVTCLSGKTIEIKHADNQEPKINNASIIQGNIRADNGIIHVIDGVIK